MKPKFVFHVPLLPWLVVVTDTAHHFYFNQETRERHWSLHDVGELRLDYDALAVLFAKARGLPLADAGGHEVAFEKDEHVYVGGDVGSDVEETVEIDFGDVVETAPNADPPTRTNPGLNLGYLSELDSESPARSPESLSESLAKSPAKSPAKSSTASKEAFVALLEKHKDKFSRLDPWFLVEEDLLPDLAQEPAFYEVEPHEREGIFNGWAHPAARAKFPTPALRFYRFLQLYKHDVRKHYYADFCRQHPEALGMVESAEALYRRLRVTLVDFAAFERQAKLARHDASANLKVEHINNFLLGKFTDVHKELYRLLRSGQCVDHGPEPFDEWMHICNCAQLPAALVEHPSNFVVGDEKRLRAYCAGLSR